MPGDHRALEPPDPIPNSEVKRCIADGSVGYPHVRVGHRQALIPNPVARCATGFFYALWMRWAGVGGSKSFEQETRYQTYKEAWAAPKNVVIVAGLPKKLVLAVLLLRLFLTDDN